MSEHRLRRRRTDSEFMRIALQATRPRLRVRDVPLPFFALVVLLTSAIVFFAWRVHEEMQWETVMRAPVELRVADVTAAYRFQPTLVDDTTGLAFHERIGHRRCDAAERSMARGTRVLGQVEIQTDRRSGRMRSVLDTDDLFARYC
jgi:hypothetical protein